VRRKMFHAKIHRATVTEADLDYEGSITIDRDLLDAAGMKVYEQVDVLDISNGNRLTTYTLPGERGSGEIKMNGAAARLINPGDLVIIIAYAEFEENELADFHPTIVLVDGDNHISEVRKG
jgi:aspartate 1-decarboxylase